MVWLLIGYMFLFIHRPFEVWPWLGELHVERGYMIAMIAAWLVAPGKRFLPNFQHAAYALFAASVVMAWILSPYSEAGQPVVENYLKIGVFYVILVTSISDERDLRRIAVGFVGVMGVYLTHSLREYLGGRHTYRMGIVRMIGVDQSLGDPNSFGASIVFALPIVTALWRSGTVGRMGKVLLAAYIALSILCILLTGSRSSLVGLTAWCALTAVTVRHGWLVVLAAVCAAPVAFVALPDSLQNRFETIINPEVGSEIARQSGEGRIQGLFMGMELWAANPIAGVGPGAWKPATGSTIESHSLFGQLVGELGTIGLVGFSAVLFGFVINLRRIKAMARTDESLTHAIPVQLSRSIGMAVILLLVMGVFGHNLFRFTWLWYGGFLIIAEHVLRMHALSLAFDATDDIEPEMMTEYWVDQSRHSVTSGLHAV
jgi:hypothetical protein